MARKPGLTERVVDTLRLSPEEADELLLILDSAANDRVDINRRLARRYPYRRAPRLVLHVDSPGGQTVRYKVIPRDISTGGLGMLIGTFVYTGVSCSIGVLTLGNGVQTVRGKIVRCEHIRGRLHEVAMRFDKEIDLTELIGRREARAASSQHNAWDPPQLQGAVLYIESIVDDRELMRFIASRLGLRITVTENLTDALDLIDNLGFDAVVLNIDPVAGEVRQACAAIRKTGFDRLLLGVTIDDAAANTDDALMGGCDRVLVKPFSFDELVNVLGEFLPTGAGSLSADDSMPLESTHWEIVNMRPIILRFLNRMEQRVNRLGEIVHNSSSADELLQVLRELKGSATSYGYPAVTESARQLIELVESDEPIETIATGVNGLRRLCERACRPHVDALKQM